MTTRSRRPSAYQPRPATLPPGTHFRRPSVVPTADAGPESGSPVVAVEERAEPPIEQLVVVAEPHDAEEAPAQLDRAPSRRTRPPALVFTAVVLVATLVAYLGWRLVGEGSQDADPTPLTSTSTPSPTPTPTPSQAPSASLSATASPSVDVPPVEPPDGGSTSRSPCWILATCMLTSGCAAVTPLTALRLSVPADPLVDDRVVASNLRVSADGKEADVPTSLGSAPAVITLADVHRVHLTYRLAGAVLRSPSRADRALARMVALDLDLNGEPRREPTTISFRGGTALSVICDGSAGGVDVRCGRRDDTGDWQVRAAAAVRTIGSWPCSAAHPQRPLSRSAGSSRHHPVPWGSALAEPHQAFTLGVRSANRGVLSVVLRGTVCRPPGPDVCGYRGDFHMSVLGDLDNFPEAFQSSAGSNGLSLKELVTTYASR